MTTELIHDRGRGPELIGTRITVYNLLPHFLDPTATEADIAPLYDLTLEQVAAARAYVLNNADEVLAQHLEIEQRIAAGNPPEVIERAQQTHANMLRFKQWLDERRKVDAEENETVPHSGNGTGQPPSFREWLAEQESGQHQGM